MDCLKFDHSKKFLEKFEKNKAMWKWLLWCLEIPRGSGHTEQFRAECHKVAKEMGVECFEDKVGNILMRKPATPGYEHLPGVVIQGHSDIVNASDLPADQYDPLKDPVIPRIEGPWLMATGTSLGADDGSGVAIGLALMESKDIPHPHLELLITVDEETGMYGVEDISSDFLHEKTKIMLNLDSEETYKVCVGSAGGFNVQLKLPLKYAKEEELKGMTRLQCFLTGFAGGHSGVQIHEGKGSALQQFARIMLDAPCKPLVHCIKCGTAHNAIPRELKSCLYVPTDKVEAFKKHCEDMIEIIRNEFETVENKKLIRFEVGECTECEGCQGCDEATSVKIFQIMSLMPVNPLRMSPDIKGLVESSCATTIAKIEEDTFIVQGLARTSRASQFGWMETYMKSIAELAGAEMVIDGRYPGWLPNVKSDITKWAKVAHVKITGKEPEVYAVHAGLECGLLQEKYPRLDAVSLGPQLENPHTPQERMDIKSCDRLNEWVIEILKQMKE